MATFEASESRRRKWSDIVNGMFMMLSVFLIADGVRKIIHHNDLGWFLAPVWAFVLVVRIVQAVKQR
jgi:hypothetical protein